MYVILIYGVLLVLRLFAGNSSSIHPLDYKTLPELADFSLNKNANKDTSTTPTGAHTHSDVAMNQHINDQRAASAHKLGGIPWQFPNPSTLAYLLGQDLLVHPITLDVDNRTAAAVVKVSFPELSDVIPSTTEAAGTVWLDWWDPSNADKSHKAGDSQLTYVPIESFPVFVRKGAFLPLHPLGFALSQEVSTEETQLLLPTTEVDMSRVHFTWFAPAAGASVQYTLRESVSEGNGMVATASFDGSTITAQVSAHTGELGAGFEFIGVSEPSDVQVSYWPNSRCVHKYALHKQTLTVSCAKVAGGLKVTVTGVTSTM